MEPSNFRRSFASAHSQISVTMNIYGEVSSGEMRKALKKLGDRLGS